DRFLVAGRRIARRARDANEAACLRWSLAWHANRLPVVDGARLPHFQDRTRATMQGCMAMRQREPPPSGSDMPDAAPPVSRTRPALEVTGLGKRVPLPSGELAILDGIGFSIAAGDSVAIVGASGSGKSTLLSLMAGLDTPSSGEVRLDGAPLSALDEDGRAKVRADKVGFVFQSFQLLPSLT